MPDLIGRLEAEGRAEAQEAGLEIGNVIYESSNEVGGGEIFYQSYSKELGVLIGTACHRGHLHPLCAGAGYQLDRGPGLD